ncbi:hypothetical protein HNP40_000126 [Mycobacteroides chelonae]|nr:hypothetical protein [Mycobacteroides chelonae]
MYAPGLPDADAVRAVYTAADRPVNLLPAGFALNHPVQEIAQWSTFGFATRAIGYADANALFLLDPSGPQPAWTTQGHAVG